jgi:hypothetical protein|tara:strand:+ start:72 stop:398 length:327 start_codon:yes stop_codon:yes gene_type:complete
MSTFHNIASATTTTLLQASDYGTVDPRKSNKGSYNSVQITNLSSDAATVSLYIVNLADASIKHYVIKGLAIPARIGVVFDDKISFNVNTHSLKLDNSGEGSSLSVIID